MADSKTVDECLEKEVQWLNKKRRYEQDELNERYEEKIKRLKQTIKRAQEEDGQTSCEDGIGICYVEERFEELLNLPYDHFIVLWKRSIDDTCLENWMNEYGKREGNQLYFYKSNILVKLGVIVTSSSYERFDPDCDRVVDYYVHQRSLPCIDAPLPAFFEADKNPLEDEYVISSCWQTQNQCFEGEMPGKKSLFIIPTINDFENLMDKSHREYDFDDEDVCFDSVYGCYTVVCRLPAIVVTRRCVCKLQSETV